MYYTKQFGCTACKVIIRLTFYDIGIIKGMVLFAIAAQCVRSARVHIAIFATAALCVRSSHVRYYSVCGHLKYGIARYSSALCLKCGIIQYTCVAFYDSATQCVRSFYVRHYTIWQLSVSGYHTFGFMQYGNTVWLHRSTV